MISKTEEKWFYNCLEIAKSHNSNGKYSVVALIIKNGKIISIGKNNYKKSAECKDKNYKYKGIHAELDAIVKLIKYNKEIKNLTIFIAGVNYKGRKMNTTKPCNLCYELIKRTSVIRKIIFIENGIIKKEIIK